MSSKQTHRYFIFQTFLEAFLEKHLGGIWKEAIGLEIVWNESKHWKERKHTLEGKPIDRAIEQYFIEQLIEQYFIEQVYRSELRAVIRVRLALGLVLPIFYQSQNERSHYLRRFSRKKNNSGRHFLRNRTIEHNQNTVNGLSLTSLTYNHVSISVLGLSSCFTTTSIFSRSACLSCARRDLISLRKDLIISKGQLLTSFWV